MSEEKKQEHDEKRETDEQAPDKTMPARKPPGWLSTPSQIPPCSPEYRKGGWGA